ncbi:hypothetical protein F3Y22_tig00111392pilonHSYRG00241 [Hibiscus syriacus]|uniref:Integrase catalytic domain-containing protein n=1 Tax=Hibiscus syriacus TaxID=106335 RepID=A0A6A2YL72_HIBSY|nr:hypothetical protein F3Y22_tig00111392pilonHSYRG00241 [Hibiscus syriacus]
MALRNEVYELKKELLICKGAMSEWDALKTFLEGLRPEGMLGGEQSDAQRLSEAIAVAGKLTELAGDKPSSDVSSKSMPRDSDNSGGNQENVQQGDGRESSSNGQGCPEKRRLTTIMNRMEEEEVAGIGAVASVKATKPGKRLGPIDGINTAKQGSRRDKAVDVEAAEPGRKRDETAGVKYVRMEAWSKLRRLKHKGALKEYPWTKRVLERREVKELSKALTTAESIKEFGDEDTFVKREAAGSKEFPSLAGSLYYVTFIDDSTRKVWVYFLKKKSEIFDTFRKWKAMVENETGLKVKQLRSDNGGEYKNRRFRDFCANNGIKMETTVPMTPQQNGVAERLNRTLNERARSMRIHDGLPKFLWAEAINTVAYLINRGPSIPLDGRIPEEVWSKKEINLSHLRVFGCISYVHIDSAERSKLDAKSNKCVFVGYGGNEFSYRFWDYENRKIIRSRDVIFNENVMYKDRSTVESSSPNTEAETKEFVEFEEISRNDVQINPEAVQEEPECYDEAMQVEDSVKWESSMKDEMDSLMSNQTWELAELPPGKKALHNKWIYKIKEEHDGSKRYKARLVVKGFSEKKCYKKFDSFMGSNGFTRCQADHCCYIKRFDNSFIILLLYVDDMLVASSDMQEIINLKQKLSKQFAMKDLGTAKQILGMRIKRNKKSGTLILSQAEYINKVLSRPDIAQAVGVVSRYMNNPSKIHWEADKWILRYLWGTTNKALCFKGVYTMPIGYIDVDLAGNVDIRRSTTRICRCYGSQQGDGLALKFLGRVRTKHIQLRYHFIRSLLEDGILKLEKISGAQNPTDMLTKTADSGKHGDSDSSSILRSADDELDDDERLGQVPDSSWAVQQMPSPPTASGMYWLKDNRNQCDSVVYVPDICCQYNQFVSLSLMIIFMVVPIFLTDYRDPNAGKHFFKINDTVLVQAQI